MKVIVLLLIVAFQIATIRAADSKQTSMDRILDLEKVASIRVLSMPERDFVRAALTPELLLANYRSSFELKRAAPNWKGFEQAVKRTTLEGSSERGDHRWAILFRDSAGRTKHTLAVDRKRRFANLNGQAYSIRGDLLSWLKGQTRLLIDRE